jgi:hypothetical protein
MIDDGENGDGGRSIAVIYRRYRFEAVLPRGVPDLKVELANIFRHHGMHDPLGANCWLRTWNELASLNATEDRRFADGSASNQYDPKHDGELTR